MAKAKSSSLKAPLSDGGYKTGFLGAGFSIKFPELNASQKKDIVKVGTNGKQLDYIHFSLVMCKSRRLAYFTAVNIDGTTWQDNDRDGAFKEDPRIDKKADQLGRVLYSADKSDFDKGHLVRREDPEWGEAELSVKAGKNTFWYTNCSPQHKSLNRKIWAELEANILHTGADGENLKINLFTGPVLAESDGIFVTKVDGQEIKIPNLFWKVVVWTKSDGNAYAVGFLQSQEKFLLDAGIIKKQIAKTRVKLKSLKDEDIFEHLKFKDGNTYQVKIEEIEQLTGLRFNWPNVKRPFKKVKPKKITGTKLAKATVRGIRAKGLPQPAKKLRLRLKGLVLS